MQVVHGADFMEDTLKRQERRGNIAAPKLAFTGSAS
jgi:hypothetical protein